MEDSSAAPEPDTETSEELRRWLSSRARLSSPAIESTLARLHAEHVFEARDLEAFARLCPLESCVPRLTAARIRAALCTDGGPPPLPSPPPSPPTGAKQQPQQPQQQRPPQQRPPQPPPPQQPPPQQPLQTGSDALRAGLSDRPVYKPTGLRMDMKTAIHTMRLKFMQETIDDFQVPWYILDPTGDIISKQRRMARRERQHNQDMETLRQADVDGDGQFSMEELQAYSKQQTSSSQPSGGATPSLASAHGRLLWRLRRHTASWISRVRRSLADFTLYPWWDLLTMMALLFTAAATPCACRPPACRPPACQPPACQPPAATESSRPLSIPPLPPPIPDPVLWPTYPRPPTPPRAPSGYMYPRTAFGLCARAALGLRARLHRRGGLPAAGGQPGRPSLRHQPADRCHLHHGWACYCHTPTNPALSIACIPSRPLFHVLS